MGETPSCCVNEEELKEKEDEMTRLKKLDELSNEELSNEEVIRDYERSIGLKEFKRAMYLYDTYGADIDLNNHFFKHGDHALHYAIREEKSKFAIFLLENGVDVMHFLFFFFFNFNNFNVLNL